MALEFIFIYKKGDEAIKEIQRALDKGENVNKTDDISKRRPIHLAAIAGNLAAIEFLLQKGAELSCDPETPETTNLFYWMVSCQDVEKRKEMLKWLLETGSYKHLKCDVTEYHVRAALGEIEYFSALEDPASHIADKTGLTRIHYLISSGLEISNIVNNKNKVVKAVDLNYAGDKNFPLAHVLALQGKFTLLKEIYQHCKKKDVTSLHLNDVLNNDLAATEVHYVHKKPPLSFYLADRWQCELINDYCDACKEDTEIDIQFDYKSGRLTLPVLAVSGNKFDLFRRFTKSKHRHQIDYTARDNLEGKTLKQFLEEQQNKNKIILEPSPQEYLNSLDKETQQVEAWQIQLNNALKDGHWDKADEAILAGANPNRIMHTYQITPVFYAISQANIPALNYLVSKNFNLFDEANKAHTHPLFAASLIQDDMCRETVLQWMLDEPQFSKLGCGSTRDHILASLGKYLPQPRDGTADELRLWPFDFLVLSGLRFIKPTNDKNKNIRKNIIKQLTPNSLEASNWLSNTTHFGLLAYVKDFESIDKALSLGINVNINEVIPFVIENPAIVTMAAWMVHKEKSHILWDWLKRYKALSIDLHTMLTDCTVTKHNKPITQFQYLVEKQHWDILREAVKNSGRDLTSSLFDNVVCYIDNNHREVIDISLLSFLLLRRQWNLVEWVIKNDLQRFADNNNNNITANYNVRLFFGYTYFITDGLFVSTSLARALIENMQIEVVENLWRLNPNFIQLDEMFMFTTIESTAIKLASSEKGFKFLIKIIERNPELLNLIDLNEVNEEGLTFAWLLAYYKQFNWIDKILDHYLQKPVEPEAELINVQLSHSKQKGTPLIELLRNNKKQNIISKINKYNQFILESRQPATSKKLTEKPSQTISAEEQLKTKQEKEYAALEDELKKKFIELFNTRITAANFTRKGTSVSVEFTGTKEDLDKFHAVISQYVKPSARGKKILDKPKEVKTKEGSKVIFCLDNIPIGILRHNFILDANVVRQLKNLALNKKEKVPNDDELSRKIKREITEEQDINDWIKFIDAAVCRHMEGTKANWNKDKKCIIIDFSSVDAWEMWSLINDGKKKPSKKKSQYYQITPNFIEEAMLLAFKKAKEVDALVEFNESDNQLNIYPNDYAPKGISKLNDLICKTVKENCKVVDKPKKETSSNNNNNEVANENEENIDMETSSSEIIDDHVVDETEDDDEEIYIPQNTGMYIVEDVAKNEDLPSADMTALNTLSDIEKVKWLFTSIAKDGQAFNFLTKTNTEASTHTKWTPKPKQWIVSFDTNGVKSIGSAMGLKSTLRYFEEMQSAINTIFPGFMKLHTGYPTIIILNTGKHDFEKVAAKLQYISKCYKNLLLISDWEPIQDPSQNDNNNVVVMKPASSSEIDTTKITPVKKVKELSEREIYATLARFSSDKNLVYHLNVLLGLTQNNANESKDKNHIYYLYLVHLQTVMVLLDKHESRVSKKIFNSIRNIIRHAYLSQEFEPAVLYTLMTPLLLAIKEVNNFIHLPATSLKLFSPKLRLDLQKILQVVNEHETDLQNKTLGNSTDKESEIPAFKAKINEIRKSSTIAPHVKRKVICMLCALIGETEKIAPYNTVYATLGHDDDLVEMNFNRHINKIYYKNKLDGLKLTEQPVTVQPNVHQSVTVQPAVSASKGG